MFIEQLNKLRKIGERPCQPIHLINHDSIDPPISNDLGQLLQSRPIHAAPGETAIVETIVQGYPTFMSLTFDICLTGLTLRVKRIEVLLHSVIARYACV